jgi:transcriptional regulator with XRE-family HTH domain
MTALAQRPLPPSVIYSSPIQHQPMQEWMCLEPQSLHCRVAARGFTFDHTGNALLGVLVDSHAVLANVVLTCLSTTSTSGCVVIRGDADQLVLRTAPVAQASSQPLFELRRLSGLSWEQLAEMIGVERRSVHNWAAGKTIALKNQQRIGELLNFVRYMDRGSAHENATLLLGPTPVGRTLFQLLAKGEFTLARTVTARGSGRFQPTTAGEGDTRLGVEHFGRSYERGQDIEDDGQPTTVHSKPKLRRLSIRKAPGR